MPRRRYFWAVTVGVLIAVILGVACLFMLRQTIDPSLLRGPYQVRIYQGGRPTNDRVLTPGSAEEQVVMEWLASHRHGWWPSLITYAPKRVIRGDGFHLNLFPSGLCVLKGPVSSGSRMQVTRQLTAAEAETLIAVIDGE